MAAYKNQKQTVWTTHASSHFNHENRLIFFAETPGKANLGTQYGESRPSPSPEIAGETEAQKAERLESIRKAAEQAKTESAEARKSESEAPAEAINPFNNKSFEAKIADPQALENGRLKNGQLLFKVEGVERSFRYPSRNTEFNKQLQNTQTPEEFKYLCYKHLYDFLSANKALDAKTTKKKYGLKGTSSAINNSNLAMESYIRQTDAQKNAQPEAAPITQLFEPEAKIEQKTKTELAKDQYEEQETDFAKYGQNIEFKKTEFGSIGTTGLYRFELGANIKDFDKTYKIKNAEVQSIIESDSASKNLHQLSNYKIYEDALSTLGVSPNKAPIVLNQIVTGDSMFDLNDRLNFNDILEKTGAYSPTNLGLEEVDESSQKSLPLATKFAIEYGILIKKTTEKRTYQGRDKDMARLDQLTKIYIASEKILQNLEKESIKDVKKSTDQSKTNHEKAYENLYKAFRAGEIQDQEGEVQNDISDFITGAEDTYAEVTLDKEASKFHDDERGLRKQFSASAMAQDILDTPIITLTNKNGEQEEYPLFTMKDGEKVYNDKNITLYLNHLIKLGLEEQSQTRQIKADLEAGKKVHSISDEEKEQNEARFNNIRLKEEFSVLTGTLTGRQIQLIRDGYAHELNQDKIKQQQTLEDIVLSKDPGIAKIQMEALKAGYPTNEIKEVESKIVGAVGAQWENSKFKGGAIAIPVPLGNNFGVAIAITTTPGLNASFGMVGQLYKGDIETISAGGSIGLTVDKNGPKPVYTFGLMSTTKIGGPYEFLLGIGGAINGKEGTAGITIGLKYNEQTDTELIKKELNETAGFTEAEEAIKNNASTHELATILRKTEAFKNIPADPKTDYAIVATYKEKYQPLINATAQDESHPPLHIPITTIGGGVAVNTKGQAGIVLGVELRFGSVPVFQLQTQKAEELAKTMSQAEMDKFIATHLSTQAIAANKENVVSVASTDDLYLDADGNLAVLDHKNSGELPINRSTLSGVDKSAEGYQMKIEKASVQLKDGEPAKEVLELKVENDKFKDIEIHVDAAAKNLGVVFNKPGQHIYLPGSSNDIIVVRENFKYRFNTREGGPAAKDIIVITTRQAFARKGYNRDQIIAQSSEVLEKKWVDNKSTDWDIRKGTSSRSKDQINYEKAYHGEKGKTWKWENYNETIDGVSKSEYGSIQDTAKKASGLTQEELETLPDTTGNWTEISEWLYGKMAKDIKSGNPRINDYPALIKRAKEIYSKAYNEEIKPEDWNAKMSGQMLTIFQHKYFVNLWEKGDGKIKGKEALKKGYENNSMYVAENVLAPTFKEKILKLGIKKTDAEAALYAKQLALKVQKVESDKFNQIIDGAALSNPPTAEEINALIKKIPGDKLIYSGTYVRSTKESLLTGGPKQFTLDDPNYPRIGTIGNTTSWKLDSSDPVERDIARIIFETMSPVPSASPGNFGALRENPLAKTLSNFPATGLQIGAENYRLVVDFLTDRNANAASGSPTEKALQEFIKFAEDVRMASISGPRTIPLSIIEGQGARAYRVLTLKTGAKLLFPSQTVESGSYGQCGNLSLMAKESMILVTPGSRQIAVIGGTQKVHTGAEISEEKLGFLLGATIMGEDKNKPEGDRGKQSSDGPDADEGQDGKQSRPAIAENNSGRQVKLGPESKF